MTSSFCAWIRELCQWEVAIAFLNEVKKSTVRWMSCPPERRAWVLTIAELVMKRQAIEL